MPIDADGETIDGKPERLPKQISRRLLPKWGDPEAQRILDVAVSSFLEDLKDVSRNPKLTASSAQSDTKNITPLSKQSNPTSFSGASLPTRRYYADNPGDTTEPGRTISALHTNQDTNRNYPPRSSIPSPHNTPGRRWSTLNIERERQPYTAEPGNGKVYVESLGVPRATRVGTACLGSRDPEPQTFTNQMQSSASNPYMPQPQPNEIRRDPIPHNYRQESYTKPIDDRKMPLRTVHNRFSHSGPASKKQPYTVKPGQNEVYEESLGVPLATRRAISVDPEAWDSEPQKPCISIPRHKETRRGQFPPLANGSNLNTDRNYVLESLSSTSNTASKSPLPQDRDRYVLPYDNRWSTLNPSYLPPSTTVPRDPNHQNRIRIEGGEGGRGRDGDREYGSKDSRRTKRGDKGGLFPTVEWV